MECDVQKAIQSFLRFYKAWIFKVVTSSRNGTPDLIACLPLTKKETLELLKTQDTIGLFVAVEVKDAGKPAKGRKLQEIQLKRIRHAGGISLAANSVSDVKRTLKAFKTGF